MCVHRVSMLGIESLLKSLDSYIGEDNLRHREQHNAELAMLSQPSVQGSKKQ